MIQVSILAESACNACRAKALCSPGESREKIIEVNLKDFSDYKIGQQVEVTLDQSKGNIAVILGYIVPFLLMISALLVSSYLIEDELIAGLISLGILAPYFLILYFFKQKFIKTFEFRILR